MANTIAKTVERRDTSNRLILAGLMSSTVMMVLNGSMFGVALPAIRDAFNASADVVAWLVTAYTLAFTLLMPLYGRLGDVLGKKRLFQVGINIFLVGTIVTLWSPNLAWLVVGRVVQGFGVAGLVPLAMAIIAHRFPAAEQGKMLGTWNSAGPATGMVAPLLGGFLIDTVTWRAIFWPVLVIGVLAILAVRLWVPEDRQTPQPGFLKQFDWGGLALLSGMVTAFIIYVSSRPITGVPALQDWRFLLAAIILLIAFIRWEGRHPDPFVRLSLFSHSRFTLASVGASLRMFIMNSVGFLIPLYLADVYQLSASATGFVLTLHAAALLITMRLGGHLADTLGSRRPVMVGSAVQGAVMVAFALLPAGLPTTVAIALAVVHGLGAGASLAPLHRAALGHIDPDQAGSAAGMYSMIRFGGLMLGTALCGVVLQFGLDWGLLTLQAYQLVFWMVAVVALLAMVVGYRLGATD